MDHGYERLEEDEFFYSEEQQYLDLMDELAYKDLENRVNKRLKKRTKMELRITRKSQIVVLCNLMAKGNKRCP